MSKISQASVGSNRADGLGRVRMTEEIPTRPPLVIRRRQQQEGCKLCESGHQCIDEANEEQARSIDIQESNAREQQNLISEITTRYFDSLPDHPAVNRLMSNSSFEDLVTGTNSTMRTWKTSFDLVMKFITPRLITSYLG